ncbi:hypothetical protein BpHYR1_052590 [Brachionus plicatilis]|uniref:Uncharacterized protein n=1 Tax=Brachionus plicatilis TaxID=10195 RepID=A0A3M7S449_BRAPC|nr:hypothetical protein BpHYR1_052590 [Brachionus plicatilis]
MASSISEFGSNDEVEMEDEKDFQTHRRVKQIRKKEKLRKGKVGKGRGRVEEKKCTIHQSTFNFRAPLHRLSGESKYNEGNRQPLHIKISNIEEVSVHCLQLVKDDYLREKCSCLAFAKQHLGKHILAVSARLNIKGKN